MSKPRSDSVLLNLPPEQQERIYTWLTEGVDGNTSYSTVAEQIYLDFNIKTSVTAVGNFWNKVVAPRRLRLSAQAASSLKEVARGTGEDFEEAALAACQQKAFELLAGPNPNPKEVIALFGSVLEARKIRVKQDALELLKKKYQRDTCKLYLQWQADEKAKAIVNSSGTNAEKIEQLGKAMFGEDWED